MAQDSPQDVIAKNITSNGTITLATAGKYCDRNIELNVNVPIPSGYVKPSGNKTITTNGTYDVTQYSNAMVNVPIPSGYVKPSGNKTITTNGTYDITNYANVIVNVPVKPTQFINVLEYADRLDINKRWATAGNSYNTTQPNAIIAVTLDLNKLPNPKVLQKNTNEFRFRGCTHVDSIFAMSPDGVTYSAKSLGYPITRIDEYGDAIWQRGYISERYIRFNIGLVSVPSSSNTALAADFDPIAFGCIVTFNEPIGNGGCVT